MVGEIVNPRKNMMTQFVLGSFLLISCVVFLAVSQQQAGTIQAELRDWQSLASKLASDVLSLHKQAQHYKLNAPRDFESYNRDVAVFYKQFQQQLSNIEKTIELIDRPVNKISESAYLNLPFFDIIPITLANAEQKSWYMFWTTFKDNLDEQIGNPKEPRLEWGAEHIISTSENIIRRLTHLNESVTQANDWFMAAYERFSWIILSFVLLIILSTLALFAHYIVRPIVTTTKVCQAVSSGQYGEKVKENGTAEVKDLQIAFNDLSSRSKLLMDMLNDVNKPGDVSEKLLTIYESGKAALGCSWIGLMSFNEQRAELNASVPKALDTNFKHRHVSLNKAFGRDLLAAIDKQWFELPDLRQLSVKRHDERFLRELHKNTMARHIVGYSFKCPNHNDFLLLFACNLDEGFTKQKTDIIRALSKLMADGIVAGLDYQPVRSVV